MTQLRMCAEYDSIHSWSRYGFQACKVNKRPIGTNSSSWSCSFNKDVTVLQTFPILTSGAQRSQSECFTSPFARLIYDYEWVITQLTDEVVEKKGIRKKAASPQRSWWNGETCQNAKSVRYEHFFVYRLPRLDKKYYCVRWLESERRRRICNVTREQVHQYRLRGNRREGQKTYSNQTYQEQSKMCCN